MGPEGFIQKQLATAAGRHRDQTIVPRPHFQSSLVLLERQKGTYNRRDSQMVTHSSTSRPVQCLCMAERTGCPVFTDLWSYVRQNIIRDNMLAIFERLSSEQNCPVTAGTWISHTLSWM
jgi:hypothetical protein